MMDLILKSTHEESNFWQERIPRRKSNRRRWIPFLLVLFCLGGCSSYSSLPFFGLTSQERQTKSWASFYYGLQKEKEKSWKEAAQSFSIASSLDEQSPRIYAHLAHCLAQLHCKEKASEALKKAEEYSESKDYLLFFDLGKAYELLHQYEEAKRFYQKAIELFPHFPECREALDCLSASK